MFGQSVGLSVHRGVCVFGGNLPTPSHPVFSSDLLLLYVRAETVCVHIYLYAVICQVSFRRTGSGGGGRLSRIFLPRAPLFRPTSKLKTDHYLVRT